MTDRKQIFINSVFFVFLRHRMMRYYIHLFPFYFMIQSWLFYRACQFGKKEYLLPIKERAIEEIDEEELTDDEE